MRRARRSLLSLALLALTLALGVSLAPSAAAWPAGVIGTATINTTQFTPGQTVVVTVQNTTPGPMQLLIYSAPVLIGTGTVGRKGNGTVTGVIPAGYSGAHTIVVTGAGGEQYNFAITVGPSVSGGVSAYLESYSVYDEFDPALGFGTMTVQAGYSGLTPGGTYSLVGVAASDGYQVSVPVTADSTGAVSNFFHAFDYSAADRAHWQQGETVAFTLYDGTGTAVLTSTQQLGVGGLAGTGPTDVELSTTTPAPGSTVHVTGDNFNGTSTTGAITPEGIPAGSYQTGINGGIRGDFTVPTSAAPGPYTLTLTDDIGNSGSVTFTVVPAAGTFAPVTPARILDTRSGLGAPTGKVKPGGLVALQVTGVGGVPATGVAEVVLDVTAVTPKAAGSLTVYPNATGRSALPNVRYSTGASGTSLVLVPVGADGKVALYNGGSAAVDLTADVAGYFVAGTPTVAGSFAAVTPTRLLDTRSGTGVPVAPAAALPVKVVGRGGVPASGVSAVVVDLTTVGATAGGTVTVYPNTAPRPSAANLAYPATQSAGNLVTVPVGSDGKVALYNGGTEPVDLLVDVVGFYRAGTVAASGGFVALPPTRVLDTRAGVGTGSKIAARAVVGVRVSGRAGVPATGVAAVLLDVATVAPSSAGSAAVYPNTVSPRPDVTGLSFAAGSAVTGLAVTGLGTDGRIAVFNGSPARLDLVADVVGYYLQ